MDQKQSLTVVTAQVSSTLYYASPVWLSPAVGKTVIKEVEKLHFKSLRVVTMDFKQRTSRELISSKTQRLPLILRMQFAAASILMKMWFTGRPERLNSLAFVNTFPKSFIDRLLFGYDDSRLEDK